jgi:hypothetical protein
MKGKTGGKTQSNRAKIFAPQRSTEEHRDHRDHRDHRGKGKRFLGTVHEFRRKAQVKPLSP